MATCPLILDKAIKLSGAPLCRYSSLLFCGSCKEKPRDGAEMSDWTESPLDDAEFHSASSTSSSHSQQLTAPIDKL